MKKNFDLGSEGQIGGHLVDFLRKIKIMKFLNLI